MRVADSDHMRGAAPTTCTTPPVSLCAVGVDHLSAGATPRSKLEVHYLSPSDLPCSSPRVLLFMCRQKPAMLQRTVLRGIPGSSPKTVVEQRCPWSCFC
ncbi:uncharacterized protein LOC119316620 isoform X5 [Triticum dicoccoides]|uniref:uncharacterized protein LOC119316620 isoform X5 n=1 Tax=Triticum dicoccoides TaxID=85692 RepID=UPI0018911205|nr:uncharacterized protein LOC119316620 isoform X5 [Triticum dicoccoides]